MSRDHKEAEASGVWPGHVMVGEIVAAHGIDGTVRVVPTTDFPDRLLSCPRVVVDKLGGAVEVLGARAHQGTIIMRVAGVLTRDGAEKLRGAKVMMAENDLPPLPEGQYYWHQLVGLQVREWDTGRDLGVVSRMIRTGAAQDVFEIRRPDAKDFLVPAIKQVVKRIDLNARVMEVELIPGLED